MQLFHCISQVEINLLTKVTRFYCHLHRVGRAGLEYCDNWKKETADLLARQERFLERKKQLRREFTEGPIEWGYSLYYVVNSNNMLYVLHFASKIFSFFRTHTQQSFITVNWNWISQSFLKHNFYLHNMWEKILKLELSSGYKT